MKKMIKASIVTRNVNLDSPLYPLSPEEAVKLVVDTTKSWTYDEIHGTIYGKGDPEIVPYRTISIEFKPNRICIIELYPLYEGELDGPQYQRKMEYSFDSEEDILWMLPSHIREKFSLL